MKTHIIGRYSEIFLKRGRRRYFLKVLGRNARLVLADLDEVEVRLPHGRLLVQAGERGAEAAIERLSRIFGLNDLALVQVLPRAPEAGAAAEIARIGALAASMARSRWDAGARTFRVSVRRNDKSFPIRSTEAAAQIGAVVLQALPEYRVQLRGADLDVDVEIRCDEVYVGGERVPGPGGLPVTSNGRALLLLSGGIDSPVAGWLTAKRGVRVDAVSFDSFPLTGPQVEEKVRGLARVLSRWTPALTLHLVPFADLQLMLRDHTPAEELLLLYRRSMFRLAERIARRTRATALVTGESIGQVASQTLPNMAAIEAVTSMPVLRPLVCHDKAETIELARRLGTYPISIQPHQDCCSLFVPAHPELRGKAGRLADLESRVPELAGLEEEALASRKVLHFPAYGVGDLREGAA